MKKITFLTLCKSNMYVILVCSFWWPIQSDMPNAKDNGWREELLDMVKMIQELRTLERDAYT